VIEKSVIETPAIETQARPPSASITWSRGAAL
jgi:hypothetical protein